MLLPWCCSPAAVLRLQLEKLKKAATAAHTYFVANPSHLEMRNNIEKYRRMEGVTEEDFQDREAEKERHWVSRDGTSVSEHVLRTTLGYYHFKL